MPRPRAPPRCSRRRTCDCAIRSRTRGSCPAAAAPRSRCRRAACACGSSTDVSRVDDLLLELLDHPTDDDYLVYADAAALAGDPRGELIIIQHALANHPLSDEQ